MPSSTQRATVARLALAIGRTWKVQAEVTDEFRVVGLRTPVLNEALAPMMEAARAVYAKVLQLSEATRDGGSGATVTVIFADAPEKLSGGIVTRANYRRSAATSADLTEKKLGALGLRFHDGRWWTEEEENAEDEEDAAARSLPELEDGDTQGGVAPMGPLTPQVTPGEGTQTPTGSPDPAMTRSGGAAARAAAAAQAAADGSLLMLESNAEDFGANEQSPSETASAEQSHVARSMGHTAGRPPAAEPAARAAVANVAGRPPAAEPATRAAEAQAAALGVAAARLGLRMGQAALGKLMKIGILAPDVIKLRAGGEAMCLEIIEDARAAGCAMNAVERRELKGFMADLGGPRVGLPLPGRVLDVLEVDEDDMDEDVPWGGGREVGAPALVTPANGLPAQRPAAAELVSYGPLVRELVAMLSATAAAQFMDYAVKATAERLRGRPAGASELTLPAVALEVWLGADLRVSVAECRAAASADLNNVAMWLVERLAREERARGGGAGARGEAPPSAGSEAASIAAILAAGSSNTADPALLHAMGEAARDSSLGAGLEEARAMFNEGRASEAGARMSELAARPHLAAMLYRAGDIKHVQGTTTIVGANDMILLVGGLRERLEAHVAGAIQQMLPPTADARDVAKKLVRGKLGELDFEALYGGKSGASLMPTAAKAMKAQGGVDATAAPSLLFMRGMAMFVVGYAAAHPFDVTAPVAVARLTNEIARAVQDGLELPVALGVILDPVMQEAGRQWGETARNNLVNGRPLLEAVSRKLEESRARHLRQQLERSRPAAAAGDGGGEKGKHGGGKSEEGISKLLKETLAAMNKASNAALKPPAVPRRPAPPGEPSEAAAWSKIEGNAGKCFWHVEKGACKKGESCFFYGGTPGHSK